MQSDSNPPPSGGSEIVIPEIDVDQLAALRQSGTVNLIDVREPDEYEAGHVPGAILIPLATVPDQIAQFGPGPVHIICKSGGRSMAAAEHVAAEGMTPTNIAGGTLAWIDSGREVALGPDAS